MRQAPKILSRHIHFGPGLQNIPSDILVLPVSANLAKRPCRCNELPITIDAFRRGRSGICLRSGRRFSSSISVRTEGPPASSTASDRVNSPGVRIRHAFSIDHAASFAGRIDGKMGCFLRSAGSRFCVSFSPPVSRCRSTRLISGFGRSTLRSVTTITLRELLWRSGSGR